MVKKQTFEKFVNLHWGHNRVLFLNTFSLDSWWHFYWGSCLKTTLGLEKLKDKGRGVAGMQGVCSLHLNQINLYESWILPSIILLQVTHKGVRWKNLLIFLPVVDMNAKDKGRHGLAHLTQLFAIRKDGSYQRRAFTKSFIAWATSTYRSVPRTTSCTTCCSLTSVLLPPARHRWTHPCRQLYRQSQQSSPRVNGDGACRGGTVRMYFILLLFQHSNFPSYPCWSTLSWGLFWKTAFVKAGMGLSLSWFSFFCLWFKEQWFAVTRGQQKKPLLAQTHSQSNIVTDILQISSWRVLIQYKGLLALCFILALSFSFYATKVSFSILNQVESDHLDSSIEGEISKISVST